MDYTHVYTCVYSPVYTRVYVSTHFVYAYVCMHVRHKPASVCDMMARKNANPTVKIALLIIEVSGAIAECPLTMLSSGGPAC